MALRLQHRLRSESTTNTNDSCKTASFSTWLSHVYYYSLSSLQLSYWPWFLGDLYVGGSTCRAGASGAISNSALAALTVMSSLSVLHGGIILDCCATHTFELSRTDQNSAHQVRCLRCGVQVAWASSNLLEFQIPETSPSRSFLLFRSGLAARSYPTP